MGPVPDPESAPWSEADWKLTCFAWSGSTQRKSVSEQDNMYVYVYVSRSVSTAEIEKKCFFL